MILQRAQRQKSVVESSTSITTAIVACFLSFLHHFEARIQLFKTRIIQKNYVVRALRGREVRNRAALMFLA